MLIRGNSSVKINILCWINYSYILHIFYSILEMQWVIFNFLRWTTLEERNPFVCYQPDCVQVLIPNTIKTGCVFHSGSTSCTSKADSWSCIINSNVISVIARRYFKKLSVESSDYVLSFIVSMGAHFTDLYLVGDPAGLN